MFENDENVCGLNLLFGNFIQLLLGCLSNIKSIINQNYKKV